MNGQAFVGPDRAVLDAFVGSLFRHADEGTTIALREFADGRRGEPALFTHWATIGHPRTLDFVFNSARQAAEHESPGNFCPPVCTFAGQGKADKAAIANGLALSVECDARPEQSRRDLTQLLGAPTLVSASGGEWANPETGEIEPKLHLHWRLTEPTRDAEGHAQLEEARRLACAYVGADASAVPINHPLRWPGSVHRKGAPRLARTVAQSETEIELVDVLDRLRAAVPAEKRQETRQRPAGAGLGFGPDLAGDALDIAAALAVIPNDDLPWDKWNRIALACQAAGGTFAAFDAWSRKSSKYDPAAISDRWEHVCRFPANNIGAGTLFFLAQEAAPGWRKPSDYARNAERQNQQDEAPKAKRKASRSAKAPARDETDTRPIIRLATGRLEETVDQAERALIDADRGVYQRANMIVGVGSAPIITADRKRLVTPQILEFGEHRVMELLMAAAAFEKWDARANDFVPCNVPMAVVKTFEQRKGKFRLPPLAGIVNGPTMRDDGSLLTVAGYDDATGLLFDPGQDVFPTIPARPFRDDAEQALRTIEDLIADFPFVSDEDRSVALAALLTSCVRRTLRTAPMFAFSAPVPGSGKSKLVDLASVIATGREAGVIAMGSSPEETEKRVASILLSGCAVALDNVEAPITGDLLCQMLSQPLTRMRVLGKSESPEMPTNVLVTATGNNLVIGGDMTRRTVVCRLDPGVERPELREFDFEPVTRAKERRGVYLVAALTVLRAFHVAGRPRQVAPLGSFEEWSDLVRSALMWLGRADPVSTMETARAGDPKLETLRTVLVQWKATIGPERNSASEVAQKASEKSPNVWEGGKTAFLHPDFRDALLSIAGAGGFIDPSKLGHWLSKNKGRVIDGMRFETGPISKGVARWQIVSEAQQAAAPTYAEARYGTQF